MSNPAQLLLISDPKLFMAVVHEQDPAKMSVVCTPLTT
jgi:hypothetical protein